MQTELELRLLRCEYLQGTYKPNKYKSYRFKYYHYYPNLYWSQGNKFLCISNWGIENKIYHECPSYIDRYTWIRYTEAEQRILLEEFYLLREEEEERLKDKIMNLIPIKEFEYAK